MESRTGFQKIINRIAVNNRNHSKINIRNKNYKRINKRMLLMTISRMINPEFKINKIIKILINIKKIINNLINKDLNENTINKIIKKLH